MLATLLKKTKFMKNQTIRIIHVLSSTNQSEKQRAKYYFSWKAFLDNARIDAEVKIVFTVLHSINKI